MFHQNCDKKLVNYLEQITGKSSVILVYFNLFVIFFLWSWQFDLVKVLAVVSVHEALRHRWEVETVDSDDGSNTSDRVEKMWFSHESDETVHIEEVFLDSEKFEKVRKCRKNISQVSGLFYDVIGCE